jgi:hypothetical protein
MFIVLNYLYTYKMIDFLIEHIFKLDLTLFNIFMNNTFKKHKCKEFYKQKYALFYSDFIVDLDSEFLF